MKTKLAVLFSGGKDSTYSAYLAKLGRYELACLITLVSKNPDSYMFHTPSIEKTKVQAKVMEIPIIIKETPGERERELKELKEALIEAKSKHNVQGVISGAIESVYQSSRIQNICNELDLEVFNPLWQKSETEYLEELIKNKFNVILTGVFAYPLDKTWLGRKIDKNFIKDVKKLYDKFGFHPAGEGGEFETFVLNAPGLFKKPLKIKSKKISSSGEHSHRMELEVE